MLLLQKTHFSYKYSLSLLVILFFVNSVAAQLRGALEEPYIPGHLIVQVKENQDPYGIIDRLPKHFGFEVDRQLSVHMRAWLLTFDDQAIDQMSALNLIGRQSEISIVQNNHYVEMRNNVPNDPNYGQQWHHNNTGQGGGTPGADIKSEEAWDITTGGQNALGHDIVVCILEQVDFSHNDLQANHWTNTAEIPGNGIDDDGNGYIDDIHGWNVGNNSGNLPTNSSGHGTNVAGMIGAVGDNNLGVVGANWDVKMMNVVGYNINSEASVVSAYDYPLTQRKIYNQTNGAAGDFVVATNASWGIDGANPNNFPIWCAFYDTLGTHGILNCGATTNSNLNVDVSGDMPTACASQYMVGVGRSDRNDNFQGGYGETTINFAAPGVNVTTTANGNSYTSTTGTSFASPLTAGVIALMYSIPCPDFAQLSISNPQLAADFVFDALMNGTDPKPALQGNFITGGRLNAKNALDLLINEACGSCLPPQNITANNITNNNADIVFDPFSDADSYTVHYQEQGSGNWQSLTGTDTTYSLSGLNSCSTYELYVVSTCDTAQSNPSPTIIFNTTGCGNCIELSYCEPSVQNPGMMVNIHEPSSAMATITNFTETDNWGGAIDDGYQYGQLVLVDDGTADSELGCDPLINGNTVDGNIAVAVRGACNFSLKALNAQNAGATALIIINNGTQTPPSLGAGANAGSVNIPVLMISQADGADLLAALNAGQTATGLMGEQNEWIESFTFDGNTTVSGDDNGYRPPSLTPFQVDLGQTINFTVTPDFDGQPLPQHTRIWIDLNQDGDFTPNELVYDQGTSSGAVLNDALTIPATATLGSTRMRVHMAYQGPDASPLPDACDNFSSGEVEDYCLNINSGVSCNYNVTTSVTEPACNTVQDGEIELNVSGATAPYSYTWSNGQSTTNILSNMGAGNYSVVITDDTGCDTTIQFTLAYTTNLTVNSNITEPDCAGQDNGEIEVTVSGASNIDYNWSNNATTSTISNLAPGNYELTATAPNGCSVIESFNLSYTTDVVLSADLTDPTCDDSDDGSITATASGGTGISFQWTNGPAQATWSNLSPGTYEVTATAANGCNAVESYVLAANPLVPTADFTTQATGLAASFFNTSLNANSYMWDFGDGNTANTFNATHNYAQPDTYTVCLTSFGDCEDVTNCQELTIEDVASISDEDLESFIQVYPNPAQEFIYFEMNLPSASSIELYDVAGKLLLVQEIKDAASNTIQINSFVNGLYLYRVKDAGQKTLATGKVSVHK